MNRFKTKFKTSVFKRMKHSDDGVAAVEFAVTLPLFVALFVGSIVAFEGISASRNLTMTATTLVDLATRQMFIDNDVETSLVAAGQGLVRTQWEPSDVEVTFVSVNRPFDDDEPDESQTLEVDWHMSTHLDDSAGTITAQALIDSIEVPVLNPGDSVVIIRTAATYSPTITGVLSPHINMHRTVLRRPRFVQRLEFED